MKLPRNMGASALVKALARLGYRPIRQSGSHIRLLTESPSPHSITIPDHDFLKVGTLSAILASVGEHHGLDRAALLKKLFDD